MSPQCFREEITIPQKDEIRVGIQQPSLAKYRVPVFRELALRPGVQLFLAYGNRAGLTNAEPDGFEGEMVPLTRRKIGPIPIYWHRPQWTLANKHKSDVLILTWNSQYLSLIPALLRAKWNGVGTIVWGHGYSKRESWLRLTIRRWIGRIADAVLFYDFETAKRYVEEYRFPESKVFTAANSIDQQPILDAQEHWRQNQKELGRFQAENDLLKGPVILFVSRLHPDNRLDLLIESVATLKARFSNLRLVIVGKGEVETERLKKLAQNFRVDDHLIFTGAIYNERELAKWFLSSTVFCYPANVGLSLFHAFGYGLPVVISDNIAGQNPEVFAVDNNINGKFYKDGDAEHLTDVLSNLFVDEAERVRLSRNASQTVQSKFNIKCMVDGMASAISYVANR